jgi:hypothetical protein
MKFQSIRRVAGRARMAVCAVAALASVLSLPGCGGGTSGKAEYLYVAVPEASLRDHVSTIYNKTGLVHNGERVQVLERMQNRRFVRVRTPRGEEGWVQERLLADQQTFDQFQRLAEQFKTALPQGTATVELQVKVHVLPGRKAGYLYLLNEKQKVELLERRAAARNATAAQMEKQQKDKDKDKDADDSDDDKDASSPDVVMEDWWLVRDTQKRVGWVLGRTLYLDIPIEIAQYAEGQRVIAAFPLDEVQDGDKKVPEYLALLTENKDGLSADFTQVRVYTWNTRKHRYETAYREKNLSGSLPVDLGRQDFGGKEGTLRTFTLRLKDDDGKARQQLYKFNPPIVRKVYAPGEEPPAKPKRKRAAEPSASKRQNHKT